jgi:hypothetical protein
MIHQRHRHQRDKLRIKNTSVNIGKQDLFLSTCMFKGQIKFAILLDFSLLMQALLYLYIHSLLVASDKKKKLFLIFILFEIINYILVAIDIFESNN